MTLWNELKSNFQIEGTNKWHFGKIASSIIVLLVLFAFVIYKNNDLKQKSKDRKENIRYTVGKTGKRHHNFRSSKPTIEYSYKVGDYTYSNIEHIGSQFEKTVIENGGRYYVEFSSMNPNNSKLLLDHPVPDSIIDVANEGWKFMPGYVNRN